MELACQHCSQNTLQRTFSKGLGGQEPGQGFWAERWNQGNCFPQAGEAGVCGWIAIHREERLEKMQEGWSKRERHAETETNHTESPAAVEETFNLGSVDSHFHLQDRKWFNSSHLMVFIFPVNEETSREQTRGDLRPQFEDRKQEIGREPKDTASTLFSKQSCIQLSNKCVCGGVSATHVYTFIPTRGSAVPSSDRRCVFLLCSQPPAPVTAADTYAGLKFQEIGCLLLPLTGKRKLLGSIHQPSAQFYLLRSNRREQAAYPYLRFLPNPTPHLTPSDPAEIPRSSLNPQQFIFSFVLLHLQVQHLKSRGESQDGFSTGNCLLFLQSHHLWVRKSLFILIWDYSSRLLNDLVLNAVILSWRPAWQDSVLRPLICVPLNTKTFWLNTAVLDI